MAHRDAYRREMQQWRQQAAAAADPYGDGLPRSKKYSWTSKENLAFLSTFMTIASGGFWFYVQGQLTPFWLMAAILAIGLAVAPASLISYLIPWSPSRMLVSRILGKTWGGGAVIAMSLYLLYYIFTTLYSWWQGTGSVPEVAISQTLLCIILTVFIPALTAVPMLAGDLMDVIREERLVEEYELQKNAKIQMMRQELMNAQLLTAKGLANLTVAEREELAGLAVSLVGGIESSMREMGEVIQATAGVTAPFDKFIGNNSKMREVLMQFAEGLVAEPNAQAERDARRNEEARQGELLPAPSASSDPEPQRERVSIGQRMAAKRRQQS